MVDEDTAVPEQETAESRAVAKLRAVQAAQANYRAVHGYYDSLECLVLGNCTPQAYPPRYLSADVVGSMSAGEYRFELFAGARAAARRGEPLSPTATSDYALVAMPVNRSVHKSFCADARREIYVSDPGVRPSASSGRCDDTRHRLR